MTPKSLGAVSQAVMSIAIGHDVPTHNLRPELLIGFSGDVSGRLHPTGVKGHEVKDLLESELGEYLRFAVQRAVGNTCPAGIPASLFFTKNALRGFPILKPWRYPTTVPKRKVILKCGNLAVRVALFTDARPDVACGDGTGFFGDTALQLWWRDDFDSGSGAEGDEESLIFAIKPDVQLLPACGQAGL